METRRLANVDDLVEALRSDSSAETPCAAALRALVRFLDERSPSRVAAPALSSTNDQETTAKAADPPQPKSVDKATESPKQKPAALEAPPAPDDKQRHQPPHSEKGRRVDIQVMRALAVTVVVLFHLDVPWMRGGFVGVDIFFVISGFLVFGSVVRGLVKNEFSLLEFFARRAKRLNPPSALMLVLLVAVLWRSAYCIYHEKCAEQMHDILMASLQCANIDQMTKPQKWRFYFVGSRYWEFALGALVSHYDECIHSERLGRLRPEMNKWYWIATYCAVWASLVVASVFTPSSGYPNAITLPVCLMTALLIACKARIRRAPVVKAVGDMSYSIYLYHFPVILLVAFYEGISMSEKPAWVVTLLLIGALSSANGDSHVVQLWKLLFNYGAELNATYWSGGFTHNLRNMDYFELMWNPPPFWTEDDYTFRASFLSFRVRKAPKVLPYQTHRQNRFGEFPDWGEDFKRYARAWIRRSTCTVILVDNPIWADSEDWELPVQEWPLTCLRKRKASSCVYGQEARLKFYDIGWVRDIVRANPELSGRVEMVSLNDLVCWDGMCHSHVYDIPVFYDTAHYTAQFLDFARNYVVARLRSSSCFKRIEAAMGQAERLDTVYGPAAQPQSILWSVTRRA
eukprot:m51a1_g14775 putative acyltransferase (628) ;mRNA; f:426683-432824